ncbi:MAG: 3-hexulose-6-phosphate synthase [Anaerolineales bacterium]|nr:3-hexulose-6-phosphate synthase [Anaerolineales bacterium]
MTCKVQVALDFAEMEKALEVAQAVGPYVDILEAGTPLIKSVGMEIVRRLREQHPDKLIVADMKSTDVGAFEADMAFKAGADYTVASGITTLATIKEVQREADQWGRRCVVDLTGVQDLIPKCEALREIGVDLVLVHRSIDEEVTRGASWTEVDCRIVGELCKLGLDVMIAGGLGVSNLPLFCEYPIFAVVIGRGITMQDDPAAAAMQIAEFIEEKWNA